MSRTDCLSEPGKSPDGSHVTMQLVVPAIRTKKVLQEMHNGGSGAHSGINKTLSEVRERFYWVRCREDDATTELRFAI